MARRKSISFRRFKGAARVQGALVMAALWASVCLAMNDHPLAAIFPGLALAILMLVALRPATRPLAATMDFAQRARLAAIEAAHDMIVLTDVHGVVEYVNPAFVKGTGHAASDIVGHRMGVLSSGRQDAAFYRQLWQTIVSGQVWKGLIVNRQRNGNLITVESTITPVREPEGPITHFVAIQRDVTQRQQAAEQLTAATLAAESTARSLRSQSKLLAGIIENIPFHVFWKDRDLIYRGCNRRFAEVAGVAGPQDIIGKTDFDLPWKREEAEHYRNCDRKVIDSGQGLADIEETQRDAQGNYHTLLTSKVPLLDEHQAVIGVLGIFANITDRKAMEQALRQSHEFVKNTLDALASHIAILDEQGVILDVNLAWRRFAAENGLPDGAGGPGSNYLGVCDAAARAGDVVADEATRGIRGVLEGRTQEFTLEYPCHSAAAERWFAMHVSRFAVDGLVRVVVSHVNITKRRIAENALRANEHQLRLILRQMPMAVWVADLHLGLKSPLGRNIEAKFPPALRACVEQSLSQGYSGQGESFDLIRAHVRALGGEAGQCHLTVGAQAFEAVVEPLRDESDRIIGVLGLAFDVTDRLKAQAAEHEKQHLRQAVQAMEHVLGVVGHELRTPLASLRAMSELMLDTDAHITGESLQMLRAMHDEALRMAAMVNDLLEVARLDSGIARWHWSAFDVAGICEQAMDSVRSLVDQHRIELSVHVTPGDLSMRGDSDAVRRLVLNLLSNAAKNTARGSIQVAASAIEDQGHAWVLLEVSDTGSGISPVAAQHLGEAFALNSGVIGDAFINGAGLGLAICRGIAHAHHGRITFDTTPGHGTVFHVRLRADLDGPALVTEEGLIARESHA